MSEVIKRIAKIEIDEENKITNIQPVNGWELKVIVLKENNSNLWILENKINGYYLRVKIYSTSIVKIESIDEPFGDDINHQARIGRSSTLEGSFYDYQKQKGVMCRKQARKANLLFDHTRGERGYYPYLKLNLVEFHSPQPTRLFAEIF